MDIKAYIESGILEDYVLGLASENEMREVRCLSSIYTELADEIEAIEARLIQVAEGASTEMPQMNMDAFMSKIQQTNQLSADTDSQESLAKAPVKLNTASRIWKIAAMLVLTVGVALAFYAQNMRKTNLQLANNNDVLQTEMDKMNLELNQKQLLAEVVGNKDVKKITLNSMDSTVAQFANVYWNTEKHTVYLDASNLPLPPEGKQYQLWVLKDGQPIDQGMVPILPTGIQLMNDAISADAFAITLEDKGGKPTPTLEQLKVLGKA